MTPEKALKDYQAVLTKIQDAEATHAYALTKLTATKQKIEAWLLENVKDHESPEWLIEANPNLAWVTGVKNDGTAVKLHMLIDDTLVPQMETKLKDQLTPFNNTLGSIEAWALEQLLKRGAKNFKADGGTVSLKTDVKYKIEDKPLLVKWALENGAASELTISLRPNSKFASQIVENTGELMPGVSSYREQKCTFTRS